MSENKIKKFKKIKIAGKEISEYSDCFIIAEIGHNHQGNLEICKKMFLAAKESGVDAVKLQKRHNKKLYTKTYYHTIYNSENAYGSTYGLHREALEFSEYQYKELKKYADDLGLIFFATPFDKDSVDFLENIDVPCYKVASGDLKNIPLLKYIAKQGKPIILSTGGATFDDIHRAVTNIRKINNQIAILQCTATYPSEFHELDLKVINTLGEHFPEHIIGLSSHDNGIAMAIAAYTLGARIIEKHFTLNRSMKGTDHSFSLEPVGMRKMVRDLRRLRIALGDGKKKVYKSEIPALIKMGKKIVAAKNFKKGHIIKKGDLIFKSPGDGIDPHEADKFYGKKLKVSLKEDDELKFQYV
jgi:sialic acid synthase